MGVNYFSNVAVTNCLYPLLRPGSRIVFMSSSCGHLSEISGKESDAQNIRDLLASESISEKELDVLLKSYMRYR